MAISTFVVSILRLRQFSNVVTTFKTMLVVIMQNKIICFTPVLTVDERYAFYDAGGLLRMRRFDYDKVLPQNSLRRVQYGIFPFSFTRKFHCDT